PQPINFANASPPQFSDPHVVWSENLLSLDVTYADADQNIAQNCRFSIDGGPEQPLFPFNFEGFGQPVVYGYEAVASATWNQIEVKVVNGGQNYSYLIQNTASDDPLAPPATLLLWPSPARDILHYKLAAPPSGETLRIYNLRGQQLREQLPRKSEDAIDLSGLPAGLYILRAGTERRLFTKL
ncbi:MAG TPA: T9SS type A sorting domain-containing protein, partial [Candidatus Syntrophosphaera sp.]|nr:T9SS type A sorting domain-containing protein [Candidatus Syntrophosphaera sp.]